MTWFRIDDAMLDHPKWIRAISEGGPAALYLWLRAGTWSSRHLTDGVIPAHVVANLPGPRGGKTRQRAWQALADASLIHRRDDGEVTLHDYLDYNPSRAVTLSQQQRKARNKQSQRLRDRVTGDDPDLDTDPVTGDGPRPVPSRPPDLSLSGDGGCETGAVPFPVGVATVEAMNAAALTEPAAISWLPEDWRPDDSDYAAAVMAGATKAGVDECVTYWRGRKLGGDWRSPSAWLAGKFAGIRDREALARKRARDEAARDAARGNGKGAGNGYPNAGAYVPDPPKGPTIDFDVQLAGHSAFDYCLEHRLGDGYELAREWLAEQKRAGITSLTRDLANKSFAAWLRAKAAKGGGR